MNIIFSGKDCIKNSKPKKMVKLKTEFIRMRVTTSFKEKLQSMAKKNHLTVSGYIRKLVVEDNERNK